MSPTRKRIFSVILSCDCLLFNLSESVQIHGVVIIGKVGEGRFEKGCDFV